MKKLVFGSVEYQSRIDSYYELINSHIEKSSKVEARVLGLDVLPRLMVALEQHSPECTACVELKTSLDRTIDELPTIIAGKDSLSRKKLEDTGGAITQHLQRIHQQQPKGRMFATYSFIAMAIGAFFGFLLAFIGVLPTSGGGMVLGWLLGMMVGGVAGRRAESNLKKKHQLY
jgi:hypothetical protein